MKTWIRAALALALLTLIPACAGVSGYCKRNADGSIECGVDVHKDGNHDKPVK